MKKWTLLLLTILVLGIGAVYYLIPATLTISETAGMPCVADAAFRSLSNEQSWTRWWPGKILPATSGSSGYQLNSTVYTVSQKLMNNLGVVINHNNDTFSSHISLLNLPHDSSLIKWQCNIDAGKTPFQRIAAYRKAMALKENMHAVVIAAQAWLSKFDNIYGFTVSEASTTDTALMSTKSFSATYPSTRFIYGMVDKLNAFCKAGNGNITGIPMLNVTPLDTAGFQVMVAIPVERTIPASRDIKAQKMIPGRFLITDITGGPYAIEQAHLQMLNYFRDYHRTAMAIPFEYLVTDRLKESDTAKWITRIYWPVY